MFVSEDTRKIHTPFVLFNFFTTVAPGVIEYFIASITKATASAVTFFFGSYGATFIEFTLKIKNQKKSHRK